MVRRHTCRQVAAATHRDVSSEAGEGVHAGVYFVDLHLRQLDQLRVEECHLAFCHKHDLFRFNQEAFDEEPCDAWVRNHLSLWALVPLVCVFIDCELQYLAWL